MLLGLLVASVLSQAAAEDAGVSPDAGPVIDPPSAKCTGAPEYPPSERGSGIQGSVALRIKPTLFPKGVSGRGGAECALQLVGCQCCDRVQPCEQKRRQTQQSAAARDGIHKSRRQPSAKQQTNVPRINHNLPALRVAAAARIRRAGKTFPIGAAGDDL